MKNSLKLHIFPAGRTVCKAVVSVFIYDFFSAHRPMSARPPPRGRSPIAPWALRTSEIKTDGWLTGS